MSGKSCEANCIVSAKRDRSSAAQRWLAARKYGGTPLEHPKVARLGQGEFVGPMAPGAPAQVQAAIAKSHVAPGVNRNRGAAGTPLGAQHRRDPSTW